MQTRSKTPMNTTLKETDTNPNTTPSNEPPPSKLDELMAMMGAMLDNFNTLNKRVEKLENNNLNNIKTPTPSDECSPHEQNHEKMNSTIVNIYPLENVVFPIISSYPKDINQLNSS